MARASLLYDPFVCDLDLQPTLNCFNLKDNNCSKIFWNPCINEENVWYEKAPVQISLRTTTRTLIGIGHLQKVEGKKLI